MFENMNLETEQIYPKSVKYRNTKQDTKQNTEIPNKIQLQIELYHFVPTNQK